MPSYKKICSARQSKHTRPGTGTVSSVFEVCRAVLVGGPRPTGGENHNVSSPGVGQNENKSLSLNHKITK